LEGVGMDDANDYDRYCVLQTASADGSIIVPLLAFKDKIPMRVIVHCFLANNLLTSKMISYLERVLMSGNTLAMRQATLKEKPFRSTEDCCIRSW
jgi:predicted solute-binding protein